MTPEYLDWVELTDHAEDNLDALGIRHSLAIGRIKNLHGFCYEDTEKAGYNLHCPDLDDLVLAYTVLFDPIHDSKTAVVKTAFTCESPGARFGGDRFEQYRH